jgi:hypothetical protein
MTKIRSVRVFSVAKVYGLVCGVLGLLLAPFFLLGPGMAMIAGQRAGFVAGVLITAMLPIMYGFFGFVFGGLMAFLYNAIANAVGGIEIDLEFPVATVVNPPVLPVPTHLAAQTIEAPAPPPPEIG